MRTILLTPFGVLLLNLFLLCTTAIAQQDISTLRLDKPSESECRKIEEKLYLQSILHGPEDEGHYVDSVMYCMGESPQFHMVSGRFHFNNEEYRASINEFRNVVNHPSAEPEQTGEAYYYLALASYRIREYTGGKEYAERALEFKYNLSWTYNLLGLIRSKLGDRLGAITAYKKALQTGPTNDIAASNLARLYDDVHDDKDAYKYYRYADSLVNGSKPDYVFGVIRHLIQLQRKEEAHALTTEAYQKFPNDKGIIEHYSKVLFSQGKYKEQLPLARKLLAMHPSDDWDWFAIGYIYANAGVMDSAYYCYRMSLKYNPKKSEAYDNISLIYKELGMFEKAHEYVDKALALDSNYHYYYSRKSEIYSWQHDFENAYKWIIKCRQRFPQRKGYDINTGYFLQQLKRYSEALPYFRAELAYNSNDDRVYNNMGRCFAELGQQDSAMAYFQKALSINPDNSYIYHNRAALYYDQGKFDLACSDLQTSIDKQYNWIIDDKLINMKEIHCPEVNTDLKILIYEYTGNAQELADYDFIQLSDSLLNVIMDMTIEENDNVEIQTTDDRTITLSNSFDLYPNPSNGMFTIESRSVIREKLIITVYDSEGRKVALNTMADGNRKNFDLQHLPNGIYAVVISNSNSVLSSKKLVIQR